jgi:heme-degrading monooxygenase HmoA
MTEAVPALVTLHLWRVPVRAVPTAVARMALDRRAVRRTPGLAFGKLLGTGDGRTFGVRDADPLRWGLLATWTDADDARRFEMHSPVAAAWRGLARETFRVDLRPVASRGRWSGRQPFGDPTPVRTTGPVAAITRARLRPARAATFWRAVPPVAQDLHTHPGLRAAVAVGEAPIGLQGTFSLWESAASLRAFAHGSDAHLEAIRRTGEVGWYAEELFARFAVLGTSGTLDGVEPV